MYVSGTYPTLESRLHQCPQTTGDLNSFCVEGSGYIAAYTGVSSGIPANKILTPQLLGKWEREARLQEYRLTKNGAALQQTIFTNQW